MSLAVKLAASMADEKTTVKLADWLFVKEA
jgi:hypothetical protein